MQRDMDLIRELLLRLEKAHDRPFTTWTIPFDDEALAVEGYTPDQIGVHLELIVDAGLLKVEGRGFSADGWLIFQGVNWEGREFLETVRDPEVWKRTKEGASKMGGWTFSLLKDMGTAYLKHVAKERLGLDL